MSGDLDTAIAHDDFGATTSSDARAADFLSGGTALTPITARAASSLTSAQIARDAQAARAEQVAAAGRATANLLQSGGFNAQAADEATYSAQLNAQLRANPVTGKARIDWGLIPAGAAILTTGAALLASGGALAGALAAPLSAGAAGGTAAAVGTAAAADKLLATVQQGGQVAKDAAAVIDNTKKLAAAGHTDAKTALGIVESVASDRLVKGVPPGVTQPLSDAAKLVAETVPVAVAVKGDVSDLAKAIGAPRPVSKGSAPASSPVPTPALDATLRAAAAGRAPTAAPATLARIPAPAVAYPALSSNRPRWVVTDAGLVFLASTQPDSARGRYLVFDDGRVIHQ